MCALSTALKSIYLVLRDRLAFYAGGYFLKLDLAFVLEVLNDLLLRNLATILLGNAFNGLSKPSPL